MLAMTESQIEKISNKNSGVTVKCSYTVSYSPMDVIVILDYLS